MKILTILGMIVAMGLSACENRDTENDQNRTTSPSSMDKDR